MLNKWLRRRPLLLEGVSAWWGWPLPSLEAGGGKAQGAEARSGIALKPGRSTRGSVEKPAVASEGFVHGRVGF